MAGNLPRLINHPDSTQLVEVQETGFTTDALGRYIYSTWEEATQNGGVGFDAVVIGAGMFGGYCAEKIYRQGGNLRVLVLDSGTLLATEHLQNLPPMDINAPKADTVVVDNAHDPGTRSRVWGIPWRSTTPFPGLAYCLGGRSLFWGGWSPRLTADDLKQWPTDIANLLQGATDAYKSVEQETGVFDKTDYISGTLFNALKTKLTAAQPNVPSVDAIEDAPLAVQGASPASGLFSFDKWSSAPILIDAVREASKRADWQRRLFVVPRAHVTKLQVTNGAVTGIEVRVNGQPKTLTVSPSCAVVLASGTIEATRLALESFPTNLMGRNLVAHARSNTVVKIHRSALGNLPKRLETAALLVRGSHPPDSTLPRQARYHLQVTAAASTAGSDSVLFRMIPDLDQLEQTLASQEDDWIVITLRGIGEMRGDKDANKPKVNGSAPSWMDLSNETDEFGMRRAWVNLVASADDKALWKTMDDATLALALKLVNGDATKIQVVEQKPDGVGTTHHEAGTLWMGDNTATSVTNTDGRFHHISNAYVAGPAIFPILGSANPSLTALTLAKRTAQAIVKASLNAEAGFTPLGTGGLKGWQMAGNGGFKELGGNIIESDGGIGLLWFTGEQFTNFILRSDFRLSSPTDNSGIFIRFPALGNTDPANDWKPPITQGYEIQIDNTGWNPDTGQINDPLHQTGAVYTLAPSTATPAVGQWHTFEIEAKGKTITTRIDGQQVSQFTNASRSPKGFIGLQNHGGDSRVQFTRLRIKKLP